MDKKQREEGKKIIIKKQDKRNQCDKTRKREKRKQTVETDQTITCSAAVTTLPGFSRTSACARTHKGS